MTSRTKKMAVATVMDTSGNSRTIRIGYIESMYMIGSKKTAARLGYSHSWFKNWLKQNYPQVRRNG